MSVSLPADARGMPQADTRVGRFRVVHSLPRRVRLKSGLLGVPDFDAVYFQALIEALPGVHSARINTRGGSLVIRFNGTSACWERITQYLEHIPAEAYPRHGGNSGGFRESGVRRGDVLAKALLVAGSQILPRPAKAAVALTVCLDTLLNGVETLLSRGVKVQVLDALAVGLSLARGSYFTAGAISTLLALGEHLENHSEQRSADLLKSLIRPPAEEVWILRDGVEVRAPVGEVAVGDLAVFGAGEAVPIDGRVLEGDALVNQSSISGESVPVHLQAKDAVISGSVIDEGRIVVEVERVSSESSVARIGRFIDQSLRGKSKKQTRSSELADKLVPVTLGLSTLMGIATRDVGRAASLLTVDFSCAIKLAGPIAVRSGMYAAGQGGVLLKGAAALDALEEVDTLVFDKTGTLTTGRLTVTDIVPANGLSENDVLALAAGAEEHYDHPVARAVVREAGNRGLKLPPISRVDFIVAHGVSAIIGTENVLVGSYHFIAEDEGVPCGEYDGGAGELRAGGKSLLYVAREGQLVGIIALLDEPRPEAAEVLDALKKQGISRIAVLTGDHRDTARALKKRLPQIDDIRFELKPEDKAAVVEELKNEGRTLAFVGDGVNDAPALVNAHVGVCMPGGADLAREAARVLLLHDDLRLLLAARKAAERTNSIIRRCLTATVGCNSLTILLAARGLSPVAAALLHNLSTVGILSYAGVAASRPVQPVRSAATRKTRRSAVSRAAEPNPQR